MGHKYLISLISILIINTATIQAKEYYGHKKKIIIENFYVNQEKAYPQSGKVFTSKLKSALFNTNRFVVKEIETKGIVQLVIRGKILKCKEETVIKWYDRPLPARFRGTKVTNADIIVEVNLCNPNTGVIIKSFRVKGNAKLEGEKLAGLGNNELNSDWKTSALALSINKVTKRIIDIIIGEMDKYEWEAKITRVDGDKVYIDCGLECNIKAGTIVVVHKNPGTIIGKTKIIEVNEDFAMAVITENHGIESDMIVRMAE